MKKTDRSVSRVTVKAADQLGLAIRNFRKQAGMTQAQLAERAGLIQRTISKVETGQEGTEIKTVFMICFALGLEMDIAMKAPWKAEDRSMKKVFG